MRTCCAGVLSTQRSRPTPRTIFFPRASGWSGSPSSSWSCISRGTQALSLVPAAPADLLQDLTAHLSPGLARQGIVLTTQWEPGLCLLEPDLFRSLVLNLIDNSRKAIGAQGTISISCQMTERGCRLTVQDTGRGMPPEVLSHLTEAFYRVDKSRARAQGGAGLGLALCEKIAVLHQGRITFESTLGQGTTVTVSLEGGRP